MNGKLNFNAKLLSNNTKQTKDRKIMTKDTMVEIREGELDELREDSHFLLCLRAAGVDNWDGYDIAQYLYQRERSY